MNREEIRYVVEFEDLIKMLGIEIRQETLIYKEQEFFILFLTHTEHEKFHAERPRHSTERLNNLLYVHRIKKTIMDDDELRQNYLEVVRNLNNSKVYDFQV
jgi:hypothetical protein